MKHRITKLGVMMVMILLSSSFIFAQMQLNGPGAKMPPGNQDLYRILYEQIELDANGWASQDFEAAYDIYDCQGADDFIVPAEATWVIETVTAYGSGSPGPFSSANVLFYNDVGGAPSASPFASYMGVSATDVDGVMTINLPSGGLTIDGGHYWISVQDAAPFGAYGQWFWTRNINVYNSLAHWRNPLDGFGSGATSWTPVDVAFGETADFAFTLEGESYVEVGTGTSYGGYPSYYGPWGNYWRNQHTQQLYLASELGGPKDITEIAYNFERIAYPDNWLINVHITIKETSISSFTSGAYFDMTGGTEVYYSSYMIPATTTGWRVFDIDDFTYSGTQNLVIDILDGDNGYYEYPYYRTYKSYGSGYRTLIGYADYETPPNYDGASYYYDNMRFYYKPALDPGDIEGYVFNGDGLTIAGATIGIEDIGSTTSGSDGYYLLEDIPTGDQEVSATKAGYNVTTHTVTVPSGGIAYQDFVLTQPTMFISPTIHDYTLNPNEYFTTQTGILNTGDGELGWTAVIEYPTTDASGYVPKYGQGSDPVIKYGNVSDANAVTRTGAGDEIVQDGTRDVGDVLAQWPSPLGMAWGMGFDGNNLWITDPTYLPTTISEVTLDGDLTGNTISCAFGGSWFGDMASDGTYLYGVNVGGDNAIKVIELATGDLVESITGDFSSTSQRGLAYDEANDEFYVGGWNSDMIWRTDHSGATISSTSFSGVSGLAWHPQGGPDAEGSLWVVENSPGDLVTELDPNNGWAVLQSFLLPDGGGYGGAGLALDNSGNLWMPNQNTNIVYNVDTDEPLSGGGIGDWLTLDWYEGTVPAGGGLENVPTNFDASGASAGETYTAAIIFSSSPDVGTITIPCTMTILGTALVPPTNLEATLINDITGRVDLTWEWGTRAFEYFVVKRNGTTVGSTTNTYYTDYPPAFGEYCYTVVAQYDEGQTAPAGPECIMWADPEIYVDPMSLEAWVWPDHQVTVQTTIYNTGIGTLTYEFPEWTTDDFSCNYQVAMYDDFGDGWNGGELTIYVNGTPVLTDITLSSGAGPAYESFLVYDGDEITSTFVCGSFCYECSYEILDCDGEVVYTDGGGGVNPSGIPAGALYAAVPHPGFIVDVDPASGIIEEGGDETITIKYDATGYPVGDWTEDLLLESNDPDNSELTIDNTMHVYAPGLFAGNVTDGNTGLGINGVTVTAGMWQATTDPDGDYMLYVDEGTYDVYFEKLGYQEVMIADTFAQEAVTTPIDVEMFEEPYAPGWVYADPNQDDTECLVTWSLPMGPYEILYDDGSDEELVVWATAGNENAVKFTPLGYPATVVGGRLYVGDGSFPDGTWLNTEVAVLVYDDDGTGGMPGTMVDSIAALIDNFGWVDFWGLSSTFDDGDFYISMRQLNPAPNSPPLGVDYDPPTVYRSYSKLATAAEWTLSVYQDFMIRAYVEGPVTDSEIADGNTVMSPAKLPPGIEGKFFFSKNGTRFNGVPGYEKGGDIRPVTEGEGLNANRDVVDYEIARLSDFDPVAGPETGTATILADGLPGLSYNDVAFGGLDMGWYAYAVRAYYTNGDVSDWTYSNVVGHLKDVEITFIVTLSTGALPENVEISMDGDDYPFNKYFAVTDTTGIHVFDSVIKGSYDISAFKIGFETYLIPNYMAVDDDVIEIQLCEKRYPARNLYVDPLTSIATWDWPLVSAVFEDFEDETFPPEGWQALTEGMGWFRSDDGSGPNWTIPSWDSYYAVANDDLAGSDNNGSMDYLITPALDLRESDDYAMYFDSYYDGAFGQLAFVEYSYDAGATWEVLYAMPPVAGQWTEEELDLSTFSGMSAQAPVWFAFHSDDNLEWASGWAIDNVSISNGYANPIDFYVFLDGAFTASTDTTTYQYVYLTYGVTYEAAVAARYTCGISEKIYYTFTSEYLIPPRNLEGETFDDAVHVWWEVPLTPAGTFDFTYQGPREETPDPSTEYSPLYRDFVKEETGSTRDLWDVQFNFPTSSTDGQAGVESDDDYIFTTNWTVANTFYQYELDGTFVGSFSCGSASAVRDLAYVPSTGYFYGGAASTTVYIMDFYSQTTVGTISAPAACRAIGYNHDEDAFYCNDWDTDIVMFDRETGALISSFPSGGPGSYYGWAYDSWTDDGPFLWGFSQGGSGGEMVQFQLPGGTPTGFTLDVLPLVGGSQIAGGSFTHPGIVPGFVTLGGILQNELIFGLELAEGGTPGPGPGGDIPDNLIGYNVYRDMGVIAYVPFEGDTVSDYTDTDLDPVTYQYDVSALYDLAPYGFPGDTGESALEGSYIVTVMYGHPLPFNEPWTGGTFDLNQWDSEGNWRVNGQVGNPEPAAEFTWDPVLTDYRSALTSYPLDGVRMEDPYVDGCIWFDFDVRLDDRNTTGEEYLIVEVGNEDGWYQVAEFDNADGSFDWTSNHLDITGSAFGQIFRVRFVAEGVNSTDVQSWFVDNIEVYRTCSGPYDLTAEVEFPAYQEVDVNLLWHSPYVCGGGSGPGPGPGAWLAWDDGENTGGIGLTGGGVFSVASHWDPDMLTAYDGMSITKIRFVPFENAVSTTFTLMVWEGANAGTLLYEEDLDNLLLGEWNEIELQTAVPIDVTKELWFGYTVDSPDGENPAGHDAGPAVAGYGDMITLDGVAWDPLSSFGAQFDVNWNLQAYVESTDGEATALTPLVDRTEYTTPNAELSAEKGEGIVAVPAGNANRELQGYNIFVNGEFLDFTEDTFYTHGWTTDSVGTWINEYDVYAVYEDCESDTGAYVLVEFMVNVNELDFENNIAVYPNPATDVLNVVASDDITHITILNNLGQDVYNTKVVNDNLHSITTTGYEAGVYIIKVETTEDILIRKVLIAQ